MVEAPTIQIWHLILRDTKINSLIYYQRVLHQLSVPEHMEVQQLSEHWSQANHTQPMCLPDTSSYDLL